VTMLESAPDFLGVVGLDLGVALAMILLTQLLDSSRAFDRALFGAVTSALLVSYCAWRWGATLGPLDFTFAALWRRAYFLFEAIAVIYTLMSIAILCRRADRSREADEAGAYLEASRSWPAVDVFICTYNEPQDVLEKSVLLAKAMDYPRLTVWVLDDTRRAWLKDYCQEVGVRYVTRPTNEGAKAGNLNNGLAATARADASPLILVLDADFAPHRNLLKRVVGLFRDGKVAVVQTPQFYFNADPIQHNLMASKAWVDDQRIFFDVFQPAKDAVDAAFCVGTSFVVRRDRLEEIGGFPDAAVSEDINLTYTMMRRGYVTRWLNERLSVGLAAEGLPEYVTQRARWCLGTIQVALLREGPLRGAGYTLSQRVHYLHGVLNWLCKPFILFVLAAPSVYWFLGVPAFEADIVDFLRRAVPALVAFYAYSDWISRRRTLPVFMEVTHMMTAVAVTWTLVTCLYRPFGRPFKVTDKGGDRTRTIVRWDSLRFFGGLLLVSCAAIGWGLYGPDAPSEPSAVDMLNFIWAGIAALLAGVACLVCFERPRQHREELFEVEGRATLGVEGGAHEGGLTRLTTFDAALRLDAPAPGLVEGARVRLEHAGLPASAAIVSAVEGCEVTLKLDLTESERRARVLWLYARPNDNLPLEANWGAAVAGLVRRGVGAD